MKKIISSILAVLMMVSLCAACMINASAEDEPQYTLKAVVTLKPESDDADYATTRFIFDITKDALLAMEGGEEQVNKIVNGEGYGFEIRWGINVEDGDWVANWGGEYPSQWKFDQNNNLAIDVSFNIGEQTAGEQYQATKDGKMKGMMCNFQAEDPRFATELYDALGRPAHPSLKPNDVVDGAAAVILTVQTDEAYYAAPADTDAPVAPPTADFTAAIAAVALLAVGVTVVVSKKKH